MFQKLLGINWKTTMTGIGALVAVLGVILNAWRTKDFGTIFTQGQTVIPIVMGILTALGMFSAKDSNVIGAGVAAKAVDSTGTVTNVAGDVVGQQKPA